MKFYSHIHLVTIALFLFALTACNKEETEISVVVTTKTPEKTAVFSEVITGGIITGDAGVAITEKGVCWSITENPTIEDSKKTDGTSSVDNFTVTITGLDKNTTYYIRAYVTIDTKTIYGDEKTVEITNNVAFLPDPGAGKEWTIQPNFTNEFNSVDGKSSPEFTDNWQDKFFNGWTGPGRTIYTPSQSSIIDGELVYSATIDVQKIRTGCISSKAKVGYPLYMEARAKISESSLASAIWMLNEKSTQEIDNLEAYGDKTNDYFSKRLHLSHHVFIRQPFQDYQPTGQETWYVDGNGTQWADDYHNYGVLWEDPWSLSYYVDGVLVRTTPVNEIDPLDYTDGTGLNEDMHLIISAAAQPWRENQGIDFLTDPSVLDNDRSTFRIDWIRVYKPE